MTVVETNLLYIYKIGELEYEKLKFRNFSLFEKVKIYLIKILEILKDYYNLTP